MNRPTNTALKLAGIALALSGLAGALTGCGGSDSDSDGGSAAGSASSAPTDASTDASTDPSADASTGGSTDAATAGFCEKFTGLSAVAAQAGQADPNDTSAVVKGIKDWVGEMEDYGTPSELSGEALDGYEFLIATFKGVEQGATMEEIQKLGTDASAAENKKVQAFSAWTGENCSMPAAPSDAAS